MKNRLTDRIRHSEPQLESLSIESLRRSRRGFSLDDVETINHFQVDQLTEEINRIEKENKNLYLENLLYSRYLRRVESSKIVETYDEYEDKNDVILPERRIITHQTAVDAKLPEIARCFSKRNSVNPSKSTPLWSKLRTNWHEYIYLPYLLRVEKEKLSIAAYEIEQTQLDWERMKMNAHVILDHLDDLLRAVESDEISQENLITDFKKNINKFRHHINVEKLTDSRSMVPGELVIHTINKRIHSYISLISLLNIDTTRTQLHIRTIDTIIHNLDDLHDKMDINFVRTRKIDYLDVYEKLDRKYKMEKSSQYSLFNRLQQWKKILSEQEKEKIDYEDKYEFLKNYLEKLNDEINSIKSENIFILNENISFKNRISDTKNVPTITDYAHIIQQTNELQHEIHIWTKRLNIAQVSLYIYILKAAIRI